MSPFYLIDAIILGEDGHFMTLAHAGSPHPRTVCVQKAFKSWDARMLKKMLL